jgi:hypothetical protein
MMDVSYSGTDKFNDISGHWARMEINAVADAGWIWGSWGLGNAFEPDRPISRAETAAIINRVLDRLPEGPEDLLPGMREWIDNANTDAWYYLYLQEASNSHYYKLKDDGVHEQWLELLLPERPWSVLERPESKPEDITR